MRYARYALLGVMTALALFLNLKNASLDQKLKALENKVGKYDYEKIEDVEIYRVDKKTEVCFVVVTPKGSGIDCQMKPVPAKVYKMQ